MTARAALAAVASVLVVGSGGTGSQDEGSQLQTEPDRLVLVSPADQPRLPGETFDRRARQSGVLAEQRVGLETPSRTSKIRWQELDAAPDLLGEAEIALDDARRDLQVATSQAVAVLLPPPPKPEPGSALLPPPPRPERVGARREVRDRTPRDAGSPASAQVAFAPERSDLLAADAVWTEVTAGDPGGFRGGAAARDGHGPRLAQLPEPRPPEPLAPQPEAPAPEAPEPSPARPAGPEPAPARPSEPAVAGPEAELPAEEEPFAAAPEEPEPERIEPGEQLLIEARGLLLPAGTLQVEPNVDYTYSSSDRVAISGFTVFEAIVIGQIQVDDLERNIVQTAVDARYGVTDRIQAAVRVPYVYRTEKEIIGVGTANQQKISSDGNGLGDVEASVSWQPPLPRGRWPDVILTANAVFPTGEDPFEIDTREVELEGGATRRVLEDAPTGSGFYGAGLSSTLVWRIDPVVYFAGGGYTFNLEADKGNEFGEIDPGNEFEIFSGLNIGLNESVALNMSFVAQFIGETEQNGETRDGTDVTDARAVFGSSVALTPRTSLLGSVAIGLTDQSPDFQLTVRLPMNFDLF